MSSVDWYDLDGENLETESVIPDLENMGHYVPFKQAPLALYGSDCLHFPGVLVGTKEEVYPSGGLSCHISASMQLQNQKASPGRGPDRDNLLSAGGVIWSPLWNPSNSTEKPVHVSNFCRAFSLPNELDPPLARPVEPSFTRAHTCGPTSFAEASEFQARLLKAMPQVAGSKMDEQEFSRARSRHRASGKSHTDHSEELAVRQKNRDAQRRFRQRQRENICGAQKAVNELMSKMQTLEWEVQQEKLSARVIMEYLHLEDSHIKCLTALPEVREAQQRVMLEHLQKSMSFFGRTDNVTHWTVKYWIQWFGMEFIPALRDLLAKAEVGAKSMACLCNLVCRRRSNLSRVARFSSWPWMMYAWNIEACNSLPSMQHPGLEQWTCILEALKLSEDQEEGLLKAHTRLRQQFAIAIKEKKCVVSAFEGNSRVDGGQTPRATGDSEGQKVLSKTESGQSLASSSSQESLTTHYGGFQVEGIDWGPQGYALRVLRRFLEGERWAVYSFLCTVLDEILTPEQEAVLETAAYPFQADWHTMICILSLQKQSRAVTKGALKAMALPDLTISSLAIEPLLPCITASQLLLKPLTVLGMGTRLTYGIVLNPYLTVDTASLWPLPTCLQTGNLLIKEAISTVWQAGRGSPLHWFGLGKEDQDPYSLEPQDKAHLRKLAQEKLGLLKGRQSNKRP